MDRKKPATIDDPGKTPGSAEGPRDPDDAPGWMPGKTPGTAEGPRRDRQ